MYAVRLENPNQPHLSFVGQMFLRPVYGGLSAFPSSQKAKLSPHPPPPPLLILTIENEEPEDFSLSVRLEGSVTALGRELG